jgi:hypothetical protein
MGYNSKVGYHDTLIIVFFMKFIDTFFEESVDELHEKNYCKE